MSAWHREHPELAGTEADPWMIHDDYCRIVDGLPSLDYLESIAPEPVPCDRCGGEGWVEYATRDPRVDRREACPECHGAGEVAA